MWTSHDGNPAYLHNPGLRGTLHMSRLMEEKGEASHKCPGAIEADPWWDA